MGLRARRRLAAAAAALLSAGGLAACGGDATAQDPSVITVWNLDAQPDRIAAAREINRAFEQRTGVRVEEVAVQENQLPSLVVSAAVSGTMPDLIAGLPLALVRQLSQQQLLDPEAAGRVVDGLGADTWAQNALDLTRDGDRQLAVPSDAWAQILVYRKDLFDQRGLAPPTTYEAIRAAADALTEGDRYGITLATDPGDPFTQQTFEALALGNGCELVDDEGEVVLDDDACTEAFDLYAQLAQDDSPQGTQTVDSTRATYFAGQAAMTIWSTFLLDELGGLREDALPTCPECQADPTYLASNTGVVTEIQGPDGDRPVGYGEIASWALLSESNPLTADYVTYMMSEGYEAALAIAPEGKYPVRRGEAGAPTRFVDAWPTLPAGVDSKRPLLEIYGPETLAQLADATTRLERWAILQGQGDLLGPVVAELAVPKVLAQLALGESPGAAAEDAAQAVDDIKTSLS